MNNGGHWIFISVHTACFITFNLHFPAWLIGFNPQKWNEAEKNELPGYGMEGSEIGESETEESDHF